MGVQFICAPLPDIAFPAALTLASGAALPIQFTARSLGGATAREWAHRAATLPEAVALGEVLTGWDLLTPAGAPHPFTPARLAEVLDACIDPVPVIVSGLLKALQDAREKN